MTRYQKGLQQLKKIDGEAGEAVISSLENIAPDLGKYIKIGRASCRERV